MRPLADTPAQERLARAKSLTDFVIYGIDLAPDHRRTYRCSIFGLAGTGEIFVEVRQGGETRVASFLSRHKSCTLEDRRKALTLVDSADAYELARRLVRYWRRRTLPPFP